MLLSVSGMNKLSAGIFVTMGAMSRQVLAGLLVAILSVGGAFGQGTPITPNPIPPDNTSIATLCGKLTVGDVTKRAPTACDDSTKGYSLGVISQLQLLASGGSGESNGAVFITPPAAVAGCTTATATATVSGGVITALTKGVTGVCFPQASGTVVVHIAGPPSGGTPATAHGVLDGTGGVGSYVVDNGGSGYGTIAPGVAVAQSNGNIAAVAHPVMAAGVVTAVPVDDGGKGYISAPTITSSFDGAAVTAPGALIIPPTTWQYGGVVYNPVDLTPGAAVWVPVNGGSAQGPAAVTYPVDASGVTATTMCYGTMRLKQGYAGNPLVVTRADTTTLSVPFLGSFVDGAQADAFCAGTTCTAHLLDQCGAAADSAEPSAATAPIWTGNTLGISRPLVFDAQTAGLPAIVSKSLTIATGTFTPGAMSISMLGRVRSTVLQGTIFTTNAGGDAMTFSSGSSPGLRSFGAASQVAALSTPSVLQWIANGANNAVYANGDYIGAGRQTSTPSGSFTGGTISAQIAGGNGGAFDMSALIVHNSVLTAAQALAEKQALIQMSQITPQGRDIVVLSGDSISNGIGTTGNRGWAVQLQSALPDVRFMNMGTPGQTMVYNQTNFANFFPRLYDSTVPNWIFLIQDGVNDLGTLTAAQVETNVLAYAASVRALGSGNIRIIAQTIVEPCSNASTAIAACPKITGSNLIQLQAYNTWLRANWPSFADALSDIDASPVVGGVGGMYQPSNTGDGLHLNNGGGSAWVPIIANAIRSVRR